jgi:hypothetical protein
MSVKMIMSAFAIFILGTILSCLCSGIWIGSNEVDVINALASFNTMSVQSGGVWNAPKTLGTYWDAIVTVLSWGYPFLDYTWAIFIKIPLWIVSVGMVWGFIQLFVSIISSLVSMVRSVFAGV